MAEQTMVERVALAFTGLHIRSMDGSIVDHVDVARAAVEAMREPTREMDLAGVVACRKRPTPTGIWRGMIAAALKS